MCFDIKRIVYIDNNIRKSSREYIETNLCVLQVLEPPTLQGKNLSATLHS